MKGENYPLPKKVYEAIRWAVSVFLPALATLFGVLAKAWNWDLPVDAILTTMSAVTLFLGAIFGISKVISDKQ